MKPAPTHGYTLIELLAVVVVLGLVAGLAMPALARRAAGDPLADAVQRLREQEHRLRCLAIGRGARLELRDDGFSALIAAAADGAAGQQEERVEVRLDGTLRSSWHDGRGQPLRELAIDARGRSVDVELVVERSGGERRCRLAGLSGEWDAAAAQAQP